MLISAYIRDGDYTEALEVLQRLAEEGEPHAQYNCATIYDAGSGVKEDREIAIQLAALEAEISNVRRDINGSDVNLRTKPSIESDVVNRLQYGQSVLALDSQGDWVGVNVIDAKSMSGWVHESLLK